jgi:hypothetical protein
MAQNLILLPVFAQALLTFAVLLSLGPARHRSIADSRKSLQDMALAEARDWSETARKRSNNYKNQFELPVLFYAVCAFALITRQVNETMLELASVFVLSRVCHAFVHIGPNIVAWRGAFFIVGFVVLAIMWLLLMWRVAAAGF